MPKVLFLLVGAFHLVLANAVVWSFQLFGVFFLKEFSLRCRTNANDERCCFKSFPFWVACYLFLFSFFVLLGLKWACREVNAMHKNESKTIRYENTALLFVLAMESVRAGRIQLWFGTFGTSDTYESIDIAHRHKQTQLYLFGSIMQMRLYFPDLLDYSLRKFFI